MPRPYPSSFRTPSCVRSRRSLSASRGTPATSRRRWTASWCAFSPPQGDAMLKCSASLWSADLSNLAAEINRVEPYIERFHLDVADGHYVPSLLFFPDLVKALRPHT